MDDNKEEVEYVISRKAPPPPKPNIRSTLPIATYTATDCVSSDFVFIRYGGSQIESSDNVLTPSNRNCLVSALGQIIVREKVYLTEFRSLINKMEYVSTPFCNKSSLLTTILNFHRTTLLDAFQNNSNLLNLLDLFSTNNKNHWEMLVHFAENKSDFSYLVMDVGAEILDLFKSRLLEYNFFVSQVEEAYSNHLQVKMGCRQAELAIKDVYQKINLASREAELWEKCANYEYSGE